MASQLRKERKFAEADACASSSSSSGGILSSSLGLLSSFYDQMLKIAESGGLRATGTVCGMTTRPAAAKCFNHSAEY